MDKRKVVIQKIIKLIIDGLEEKDKGNLTSMYAIGVLQEAIADIEANALMCPARYAVKSNFLGSADNNGFPYRKFEDTAEDQIEELLEQIEQEKDYSAKGIFLRLFRNKFPSCPHCGCEVSYEELRRALK